MKACAAAYLVDLMARNDCVREAAKEAGTTRQHLYKLLETHGLHDRKPQTRCDGNAAWRGLGD